MQQATYCSGTKATAAVDPTLTWTQCPSQDLNNQALNQTKCVFLLAVEHRLTFWQRGYIISLDSRTPSHLSTGKTFIFQSTDGDSINCQYAMDEADFCVYNLSVYPSLDFFCRRSSWLQPMVWLWTAMSLHAQQTPSTPVNLHNGYRPFHLNKV